MTHFRVIRGHRPGSKMTLRGPKKVLVNSVLEDTWDYANYPILKNQLFKKDIFDHLSFSPTYSSPCKEISYMYIHTHITESPYIYYFIIIKSCILQSANTISRFAKLQDEVLLFSQN